MWNLELKPKFRARAFLLKNRSFKNALQYDILWMYRNKTEHWYFPTALGCIFKVLYLWFSFCFLPPMNRGPYCFATVGLSVCRYVGLSVCRPSVVRSISFDLFTWSIPNLVQGLPLMSRFQVTCSKVKVKPLFSAHCVFCSISFDPFTWSILNLVQGLPLMSRWSLLIFRSHVQRSRSYHSSQPSVFFGQSLLTPSLYQ